MQYLILLIAFSANILSGCHHPKSALNKFVEPAGRAGIDTVCFSGDSTNLTVSYLGKTHDYTSFAFLSFDRMKLSKEGSNRFSVHEYSSTFTLYTDIYYSMKDTLVYCDSIVFTSFPNRKSKRNKPDSQHTSFLIGKPLEELTRSDLDYDYYLNLIQ
jgi:hypothetical protein